MGFEYIRILDGVSYHARCVFFFSRGWGDYYVSYSSITCMHREFHIWETCKPYWVFPKIWENPPNHPLNNRVLTIIFTIHFGVSVKSP